MSTCYSCKAIYGIKFRMDDIKVVISPPEYVDQPTYNVNTGEQISIFRKLKKKEVYKYVFEGMDFDDLYKLESAIENKYAKIKLKLEHDDDFVYIGFLVGDYPNYGNFKPVEGLVSINQLNELHEEMFKLFPNYDSVLHFMIHVG